MNDDVTIPRELLDEVVACLRYDAARFGNGDSLHRTALADKLDPARVPLRIKVSRTIHLGDACSCDAPDFHAAGQVLAVIAEDLIADPGNEAMPNLYGMTPQDIYVRAYGDSRSAVVRRLRGEL